MNAKGLFRLDDAFQEQERNANFPFLMRAASGGVRNYHHARSTKGILASFNVHSTSKVPCLPYSRYLSVMEAEVGIEPAYTALQAAAILFNTMSYGVLPPKLPPH